MADENDDLRSSLNAAVEAAEKSEAPETAPEPGKAPEGVSAEAPPIGETAEQKSARARDEKGRFAKAEEKADEKAPSEPVEASKAEKAPEPEKPAPTPQKPPTFATEGARAPQSWRPAVREKFASLPPDVQEEAIRIDREVRRTMQDAAEAKQNQARFREIFAPVEPLLRAHNVDPHKFTSDAVQLVLTLSQGSQQMKAQVITGLIKSYGVDIQTLDTVLSGQAPQQAQPEIYRDPRVDELYQAINAAKSQRDQQLDAQAREGLAAVENLEYFEDLRMDMADLLDLAAQRNLALTPTEAYNRAVLMHPEIHQVLQQREAAAKLATNPNGSTQRARAAASSIKGSPEAAAPNNAQSRDLRAEIAAAWDRESQGR